MIASPTAEKAAQDIRKIFPVEFPLERTLALVLPDVVGEQFADRTQVEVPKWPFSSAHVAEVQDIIVRHGFTIIATYEFISSCSQTFTSLTVSQQVNLSAERLELLLAQDRDSPIFADRVRYMSRYV